MKKNDWILKALVEKKRELLGQLLEQSQRYRIAQNEQEREKEFLLRGQILAKLERNDQAIAQREQEVTQLAKGEQKELYYEIEHLLRSIQFNNQASLFDLEEEKKGLERERISLEKGTKLSGYLSPSRKRTQLPQRALSPKSRQGAYS